MAKLDELIRGLNDAQREAVTAPDGVTLVLAGAGSGKTSVIAARVAWHLAHGATPQTLAAVTFTNKASREMAERIGALVPELPFVGTFHRFGLTLLRKHRARLGFRTRPTIVDRGDQIGVLRETLKSLKVSPGAWDMREVMDLVLDGRTQLALEGKVRFRRPHALAPIGKELVSGYEERLRAMGAVDFDDLILLPSRLLNKFPDLVPEIRAMTRYLLVDEFQDTNHAQMALVEKLVGDDGVLTAVGDDDQSIYAFRGAKVENILNFPKTFPGCRVRRLELNYRSVKRVLDLANEVIRENEARNDKELKATRKESGSVRLLGFKSPEAEAEFVAREIKRAVRSGVAPGEIAVLYRANRQAGPVEEAFTVMGVGYRRIGGTSFLERKEVRDAVSWLALLVEIRDDAAFRRAVLAPNRGVGPATVRVLEAEAGKKRCSLYQAAQNLVQRPEGLGAKAVAGLRAMVNDLRNARAVLRDRGPRAGFIDVMTRINYRTYLIGQADSPAEGSKRYDRILALADVLQRFIDQSPENGAQDFLDNILLSSSNDPADEDEETPQPTLMTLHAAKGLEFDLVFLLGVEEGILPHERSVGSKDGLSEERRLLYVGITRARKHLMLSYARRRGKHAIVGEERLSRFLRDVTLTPRIVDDGTIEPNQEELEANQSQITRLRALLDKES